MIKIELEIDDAEKFKKFQRYYNDFSLMVDAGVFDFKSGKAILNRDKDGRLREISIETITLKN